MEFDIVTVRELIDSSFGSEGDNTPKFKGMETVLYLLARHLRILERHVKVKPRLPGHKNRISVSEHKIHASKPGPGMRLTLKTDKDGTSSTGGGVRTPYRSTRGGKVDVGDDGASIGGREGVKSSTRRGGVDVEGSGTSIGGLEGVETSTSGGDVDVEGGGAGIGGRKGAKSTTRGGGVDVEGGGTSIGGREGVESSTRGGGVDVEGSGAGIGGRQGVKSTTRGGGVDVEGGGTSIGGREGVKSTTRGGGVDVEGGGTSIGGREGAKSTTRGGGVDVEGGGTSIGGREGAKSTTRGGGSDFEDGGAGTGGHGGKRSAVGGTESVTERGRGGTASDGTSVGGGGGKEKGEKQTKSKQKIGGGASGGSQDDEDIDQAEQIGGKFSEKPTKAGGKRSVSQKTDRRASDTERKIEIGKTHHSDSGQTSSSEIVDSSSNKITSSDLKSSSTGPPSKDTAATLQTPSKISEAVSGRKQVKEESKITGKKPTTAAKGGDEDEEMDLLHEKLLIVSRTPSTSEIDSAVVTVAQYKDLFTRVCALQTRFGVSDVLKFPENMLADNLHKQFSMTDPMAAVQLSARLADAENKLKHFVPIAERHAKATGIDIKAVYDDALLKQADWGKPGASSQTPPGISSRRKSAAFKQPPRKNRDQETQVTELRSDSFDYDLSDGEGEMVSDAISTTANTEIGTGLARKITAGELDEGIDEVSTHVNKYYTDVVTETTNLANKTLKTLELYEKRVTSAMDLGDSFSKLDFAIEVYADEVNALDAKLASQMSEYQDALTQMQYELETSMDAMAEALAAPSEDAAAIAELNQRFTMLQSDIDDAAYKQHDLKQLEGEFAVNLEDLKKRIEELQVVKSTRDEVMEALSDKAGIAALNGMVSMEQYDAVRGDFEKQVASSYDKFNSREIVWQKAIDDLIRTLNEKADQVQMVGLECEIQRYLISMKGTVQDMLDIVGDMNISTLKKKLDREEECLACGTIPNVKSEYEELAKSMRPPVIGAEAAKEKEPDMSVPRVCLPGHPVDHRLDPRSLFCQRYCGANISRKLEDSTFKITITDANPPALRRDKVSKPEDIGFVICEPCNVQAYKPKTVLKKPGNCVGNH